MKIFEVTSSRVLTPTKVSVRRALLNPALYKELQPGKVIPILANAWFAWLAAENLIKGDWVGAATATVGIFAGPWKQVAVFSYDIARSLYASQYYGEDAPPMALEKDMASDPKLTTARLNRLTEIILDVIKDLIVGTQEKAELFKKEFGSTGGGAAVGNPNISAQAARSRAGQ